MVRLLRVLPRNSRNSQKLLVEKSLPQMRTDAHRWLGCVGFSHGIHGTHRSFWRRISCIRNFCGFCGFCGKIVWCLRGYGRMPYPPNLCPSVQSVGDYLASETSVVSVGILFGSCVGSPTEFTEFTEAFGGEEPPTDAYRWLGCVGFCGEIVWWLRGYGRMPYPPIVCTVCFVGAAETAAPPGAVPP